ncbi:hypothetical protein AK812_SmicGene45316 [Symbiodinium microadriaticum]|uniref:Uncharacterized protein n=1 Tax=Symbiodinium microadriaticum TaxID=2951 RepID=A0A1Q9BWA1_SYMMI|nr:hypothetical protein AK812_SmicGene45316 [Symbiodinium microadriaticum]
MQGQAAHDHGRRRQAATHFKALLLFYTELSQILAKDLLMQFDYLGATYWANYWLREAQEIRELTHSGEDLFYKRLVAVLQFTAFCGVFAGKGKIH